MISIRKVVDKAMPQKQKTEILQELRNIIPVRHSKSYLANWLKLSQVFTFLSIINMIQDYLLDWKLTQNYYDWNAYTKEYQCKMLTEQQREGWNGTLEKSNCAIDRINVTVGSNCTDSQWLNETFLGTCSIDANFIHKKAF